MQIPDFFSAVPRIRLRDPLAGFLGASADGIVDYSYLDVVKLAGHSCPTVASAYGLTRQALRTLYAEELPLRGGLQVEFAAAAADGVTGVIAAVVSLLTGAAGEGGFKGLGGQFVRRGLLSFGVDLPLVLRFTRCDGHGAVDAAANLAGVPADPATGALLQRCLAGLAAADEVQRFRSLWQDRVRRILLDHGDDPGVFIVRRCV